jgi:hypothetical protein
MDKASVTSQEATRGTVFSQATNKDTVKDLTGINGK